MTAILCGRGFSTLVLLSIAVLVAQQQDPTTDADRTTDDSEKGTSGGKDGTVPEQTNTEPTELTTTLAVIVPVDKNVHVGSVVTLRYTVDFKNYNGPGNSTTIILDMSPSPVDLAFSKILNKSEGTGLVISNHGWAEFGESKSKKAVTFYTHITFSLGTVSKNMSLPDVDGDKFQLAIMYELVCVTSSKSSIGGEVATSATINTDSVTKKMEEFLQISEVKAVQNTPIFDVQELNIVEVLEPLMLTLSMYLPYPSSEVEITVAASQQSGHEGLLVQQIQGRSVGSAFSYSVFPENLIAVGYRPCPLKSTLSLSAGPFVNRESFLDDAAVLNSTVEMDITLLVTDPNLVGSVVSVKIDVTINNKTWDSTLRSTVQKQNDNTNNRGSGTHFASLGVEGPIQRTLATGQAVDVTVYLHTKPLSNFNYKLTFSASPVDNSQTSALILRKVFPYSYGQNIYCSKPNITSEPVPENTATDYSVDLEYNITNIGVYTDLEESTLKFNVQVAMKDTVTEGETHRLIADLYSNQQFTVEFTVPILPNKTTFKLYTMEDSNSGFVGGGYPVFAYLDINTVLGSSMTYNISLKTSLENLYLKNKYQPMSILTDKCGCDSLDNINYYTSANVITLGSNKRTYEHTTDTIQLSSSVNDGRFNDEGQIILSLHNNDGNAREAGPCKLEIVLLRPNSSVKYRLRAEGKDLGQQEIVIEGQPSSNYHMESISDAFVLKSCPTATYHSGVSTYFKIVVSTNTNTNTGPLQIFIPTSSGYRFLQANVYGKDRNVVCLNTGQLVPTEQMKDPVNGTVFNIPFVCNRQKDEHNGLSENRFSILVNVVIADVRFPDKNEDNTSSFNATLSTASTQENLNYTFRTVATMDLGSVQIVKKIRLFDHTLTDSEVLHDGLKTIRRALDISVDGDTFTARFIQFTVTGTDSIDGTVQATSSPGGPVVGRYIRVSYTMRDACHINFTATTTNDNMPFWPGPEPQLNKILQVLNMEYISSCQKLWQGAGKSDSIPHIWVDFNTSLFNIDESRPFKVMVKGYNIQCNSTTGQQIIMVAFPKHEAGMEDENHHRLCDNVDEVNRNYTSHLTEVHCHYHCDCRGRAECRQFTLLIMHVEEKQTNYTKYICALRVSQSSEKETLRL